MNDLFLVHVAPYLTIDQRRCIGLKPQRLQSVILKNLEHKLFPQDTHMPSPVPSLRHATRGFGKWWCFTLTHSDAVWCIMNESPDHMHHERAMKLEPHSSFIYLSADRQNQQSMVEMRHNYIHYRSNDPSNDIWWLDALYTKPCQHKLY